MAQLELQHVSKHFGAVRALDDVSVEVAQGSVHAIRVLGDSARWYELVAYDFLRRLYATEAARANIRPSKKGSAS